MKIKIVVSACISLLLLGCNSSEPSSALLGKWVQQSCNAVDELDLWVQSTYEFSADGTLKYEVEGYIDVDCIQRPTAFISGSANMIITLDSSTTFETYMQSIQYSDHGEKVLEEGLQGGEAVMRINLDPEHVDISANYYIDNSQLCFSRSFLVNEQSLVFSKVADGSIDFDNCLSKLFP